MRRLRGRRSSTASPQIMAPQSPSLGLFSDHLSGDTPSSPPLSRRSRKRRSFSEEEDDLLLKLHALLGNRWSLIAGRLPGRTEKEVMNHWNSKFIKRMAGTDHPSSLLSDDHHRRRCRRRRHCRHHLRSEAHAEGDTKHPGHHCSSSSSNDIPGDGDYCATVSDAGSSCNDDRDNRVAAELNLEPTLSTPCI